MSEPDIVCKVTPWYWKRMGLMVLLFVAFTAWFFYDGKYTYPEENVIYNKFIDFTENMLPEFDKVTVEEEKPLDEWKVIAEEKGWTQYLDESGEPLKWKNYAAERDWDEKPKEHPQTDIDGQFRWAAACGVIGLAMLINLLLNLRKKISADDSSYTSDKGVRIPFDDMVEIDKRKWDHKGLATIKYKSEGGEFAKAKLDDLKYDLVEVEADTPDLDDDRDDDDEDTAPKRVRGGQKILDRILANFEGDLIESIVEEDDDEEEEDNDKE